MEEIVRQVMAAVEKSGLVEIEVSARHVHLTQSDFVILFGKGKTMTPKRDLSPAGTVSGCGESGYHRTEEKDDECSSIRPGPQGHTGGAFQK